MSTTRSGLLARTTTVLATAAVLAAGPVTAALAATPDPSASATGTSTTTTTTSPTAATSPTATTEAPSTDTATPSPTSTSTGTPSAPVATDSLPPTTDGSPSTSGTTTTAPPAPLLAPGDPEAVAAADFIATTLAAYGDHYVYPDAGGNLDPANYPDYGNTIDAILALAATGTHGAQLQASLDDLEANVGGYTGAAWGELYVGGTAKSVLGLVAAGRDPRDVGGTDLVAALRGLETAGGRFSDDASGDYTITITQALAVLALARAGAPVSSQSVQYLLDQQCADGGFRSGLGGSACTSDPDATAFAAQALLAVPGALLCWGDVEGTQGAAATGAQAALDHLAAAQQPDGSLASSDGIANANTSAVAAQAFVADGRTAPATAAAGFLASLQYDASAPAALVGGIAFSDATRSTVEPTDSDIRATPQSTLALAGGSLVDVLAPEVEVPLPPEVCPAEPTWTSSPTTTAPAPDPTTSTTAGATAGAAGTPSTAETVAATGTGALAQTGSDLLWPALTGLALVTLGAVAVIGSRRRGAHS